MTRGRLYAFWVSPWPTGESRGYPAAGGPEFSGPDRRAARTARWPRLMRRALERWLDSPRTVAGSPARDLARARPVLHVRLGAAPVGLAGHRQLPRPGARAGARRAVRHHRRAVGLRVFRRGVLPRRSASTRGSRCSCRSMLNASVPLLLYRLVRPPSGQRPAALAALLVGRVFVQHRLRVDPVVRLRSARCCSWRRSSASCAASQTGSDRLLRAQRPAVAGSCRSSGRT